MPEQNLEEPSCRCQRSGALFCFINNHMRLKSYAFKQYFSVFLFECKFFTFKIHDPICE